MIDIPVPPPDEKFVQAVMSRIRQKEDKFSWREFWRVPALGFALAVVIFEILASIQQPPSIEDALLAGNPEDILEITLEVE
jgi:hypothetical protein